MVIEARAPNELRTLKDVSGRDILDPTGYPYEVDSQGRVKRSRQYFRLPSGKLIPLKIGGAAGSSLIFCDSFGHYSAAQSTRKWTQGLGSGTITTGRSGNGGIQFSNHQIYKTFGPSYANITVGFAYQTSAFPGGGYGLVEFNNITTNYGNYGLWHVGDGRLYMNGLSVGPASTYVLNANEWYYIEVQIVATLSGNPTAAYIVRVNGGIILTGSLVRSGGSVAPTIAQIFLEENVFGITSQFSDFYVTDTEFLGDIEIICLYPNANGDISSWTPLIAGNNYLMTKEHPADDDTTYIYSATAGNQELENLDDITGSVSNIFGGQFLWLARKSLPGPATMQGAIKSSGVTVNTPTWYPSANNYLYLIQPYRKSPFTTSDFTVPEVNALQMGPTRIS